MERTSNDSAKALSSCAHGIEGEEVALLDLVVVLEELQSSFEDAALRVHIGNAEEDDATAVVVGKVNTLGDLA